MNNIITQEEIEAMKAIIAFNDNYRKKNSFVKLMTFKYFMEWNEAPSVQYDEVLLKISDISYIKGIDKNDMEIFLSSGKKFFISKKEYKEKLATLINFSDKV